MYIASSKIRINQPGRAARLILCLELHAQFPEGFNFAQRVPEMVAQVRAARDAGFASLWFPHHWLTHPMQMLQITPVMGFIAAHAEGMTIGPNILILPPLNPVHVAEEAATLDVLSGGNYVLGVGLGYRQPEFDAFGISLSERAPRFNEGITLMRRLWSEGRVSHKGRFYTVNDAGIGVKPVRPGGPPIYVAGQADVSVRRAARIGDAWLIVNTSGLGKVMSLMQTYRAALKEYGRTPMEFPITVECYVGARHATAHEECRGPLEYKYAAYAAWGLQDHTTQGSFEDFARDRFIIGDKASVNAEIARYREHSNAAAELGLSRFTLGKPGRAPPSGGYDDTAKLAQPAARVLDPHRILPYCVSRPQKQLSYLTAMVRAQQQERKQAPRLTRGPSNS